MSMQPIATDGVVCSICRSVFCCFFRVLASFVFNWLFVSQSCSLRVIVSTWQVFLVVLFMYCIWLATSSFHERIKWWWWWWFFTYFQRGESRLYPSEYNTNQDGHWRPHPATVWCSAGKPATLDPVGHYGDWDIRYWSSWNTFSKTTDCGRNRRSKCQAYGVY